MTRRALALALALCGLSCGPHLSPPSTSGSQVQALIDDDAPAAFAAIVRVFDRVLRVSNRLRTANTQACGEKLVLDLGWLTLADRDFTGRDMRELAREFLKARAEPVVVALAPGGAAARAGVRVGDHVLEVGGTPVKSSNAVARAEGTLARTGATVRVVREGKELELAVEPASACPQTVTLVELPGMLAVSVDGEIAVTYRLVEVASDDQLAFSIAHALATDLVGFKFANASVEDQFIPEPETTRLAVELSQRAGFSADDAEGLLELQAIEQPVMVMTTRPDKVELGEIPRRIVALRTVLATQHAATQDAH